MVYIYIRYNFTYDSNIEYYSICFVNRPSSNDSIVKFIRRFYSSQPIHGSKLKGITKFESVSDISSCNVHYEFNSILSSQVTFIRMDSIKHIYIVSYNTNLDTFTIFKKLSPNEYEFIYDNNVSFNTDKIDSVLTENALNKSYLYSIGFTTPQSFETVLEYLYTGHEHNYSSAIITSNVNEPMTDSLSFAIDTYSGSLIATSKINSVFVYSLISSRSIENIKTYHDATNRISGSHYQYEYKAFTETRPKVYLDGSFNDISNLSVFTSTMSVSRYYSFVMKMKDYMINKFTLPTFLTSLNTHNSLSTLVDFEGILQNNTLYYCNNMHGSLHSNINFLLENAYITLNDASLTEIITLNNEYVHVVFAEDAENNTFNYYVDYTDNNDNTSVVYSIASITYESNITCESPYVSNVDLFYVFSFDISGPSILSDVNVNNSTDLTIGSSDEESFQYKQVLNNGDQIYSNLIELSSPSKLFDGILNFSNLDNTYLVDDQTASFMYKFNAGNRNINGIKIRQPPMSVLTGNIEIHYYSDESLTFVPVSNVSHIGFDPETTRFNEEVHIHFDNVNSNKIQITIHSLDTMSRCGLSNMTILEHTSTLTDTNLTSNVVKSFFENNLLGNVDTSITGIHNNDVYFDYNNGSLNSFSLQNSFNSLSERTSTNILSTGIYNTYLVYRKGHTYLYDRIFKSALPDVGDSVDWNNTNEQSIVRTVIGSYNNCSLSYDGAYCVISGIDESEGGVTNQIHLLKKNVNGAYESIAIQVQYDVQFIHYGYCAKLSSDGNYLLITGPAHNYGVLYLYKNNNGSFNKHCEVFLFRSDKTRHSFGMQNSISDDGTYIVVTATEFYNGCKIYVYKNIYDTLTELTCIQPDDRLDSAYGIKSCISDNGEYFVVSGINSDLTGGTVIVYKNNGFDSYEPFYDLSNATAGCQYGKDIAISSNGEMIVVSGNSSETSGKCYVFKLNKSTNAYETVKEITKENTSGAFGSVCEISAEHTIIVSGSSSSNSGCVFIFRSSDYFTTYEEYDLSKTDANNGRYGETCTISRNGKNILVGGPFNNNDGGSFIHYMD